MGEGWLAHHCFRKLKFKSLPVEQKVMDNVEGR